MTLAVVSSRDRRSLLGGEYFDQVIQGDYRVGRSEKARYENCQFVESLFSKTNFFGAEFHGCTFIKSNFSLCNFNASIIRYCTFTDCDFDLATFNSAIIEMSAFDGGRAQYSSFEMASLEKVVLNTDLHGADLRFRSAKEISYGDANLWAVSLNVNCNTFKGKQFSERQLKIMLALLAKSEGNDELRAAMRELAGGHYTEMVERLAVAFKGCDA